MCLNRPMNKIEALAQWIAATAVNLNMARVVLRDPYFEDGRYIQIAGGMTPWQMAEVFVQAQWDSRDILRANS